MKKLLTAIFIMSLMNILFAQMRDRDHSDTTEIDTITVSGIAIVDESSFEHPMYYLDEDGDGVSDYHLNFGPYWYEPDSSNAVRPKDGDNITIIGGLHQSANMSEQSIIVFEINSEFWRDPYFADWNNMGRHNHQMGNHHGGMMGYGFGWEHDTITTLSISGTVLIDSTFYMNRYYLDSDNNGTPDYFLNFGPYWYQPESGAIRPVDGAQVDIFGGQLETAMDEAMIIVYEINGLTWRDSSSIGEHFGGGWFNANMSGSQTFHSPFDNEDNITMHSGWNQDGGHGHMGGGTDYPDSLFCQIFEIVPENIPNRNGMNIFASYEVNIFRPDGNNWMMSGDMMGGHMSFGNNVDFNFHYSDLQLGMYNADENLISAKYWDDQSNSWISVEATVDTDNNTVSFSNSEVSNLIILIANKVTAVEDEVTGLPTEVTLAQNYPNPFNPSTKISFTLSNDAQVTLNIYNIVGQKIATIVNEYRTAGSYTANFDASELSSGIYFYELKAGALTKVRKMNLLK